MAKRKAAKITKISRTCIACGKRISIKLYPDRSYRGGEFFGRHKIPIEGTGEWKKTGTWRFLGRKFSIVKWTGKEREEEHWECPECYEEAVCESWLEQKIEELFGKRCPDDEPHCPVCDAWFLCDQILEDDKEKLEKKQRKYERIRKKDRKK